MPIHLLTGTPGHGKTALMMELLHEAAAKAERPLFAAGIDGLDPGLASPLEDPKRWNMIDTTRDPDCSCDAMPEPHAHVVPNGSLVFVDECWKWFGHLQEASRQQTPKHVQDLAVHRHRGLDFVWTTQQPNQIYPFARGLIQDHWHVVRRFGTHMIDVYKWGELNEETKSQGKRDLALRTTRTLPTKVFGSYKSASEHTIKAKIPFKVFLIPALLLAGIGAAWMAYQYLKPDNFAESLTGQEADPALAGAASPDGTNAKAGTAPRYATAEDYATLTTARIEAAPWTAPVFDGREVAAVPAVYCMKSEAGETGDGWRPASITCLTEQGTPYVMDETAAQRNARYGMPYNPFRERVQDERGTRQPASKGAGQRPAETPVPVVGIGEAGEPPAASSTFRG